MSDADEHSNAVGDAKRVVDILHSVRNALHSHASSIERLETREGNVLTWIRSRTMKVDAAIDDITQQLTTLRRENCELRRELAGLITTRAATQGKHVEGTQGTHYADAHCEIRTTPRAFVAHLSDDGMPGCPIVLPQGVFEFQAYLDDNPHIKNKKDWSKRDVENTINAVREKKRQKSTHSNTDS